MMLKKNKWIILITSLVILLPIAAGLVLWNKLPEQMPTHWNFSGEIDGYSSKAFTVFGIPIMMLVFHVICTFATSLDPKTSDFNTKMLTLILWICPVVSTLCTTATYAAALGKDVKMEFIIPLFMGIVFLIIGNYLPKCKQNYTIGIKIPWTLNDEENWNKTHRLAGSVWTVGALVIIVGAFFKNTVAYTTFVPVAVMVFVPMIYSYIYYRKHR